jgi:anti-anti-sigma factor
VGRSEVINGSAESWFRLEATVVGFEEVLTLQGEVDVSTSSELGAHLDDAIDRGRLFVVLDLASLEFIDGSGLRVIGAAANRLSRSGGALSIRSPSPMVLRLLDIVGLADHLRIVQPDSSPEALETKRPLDRSTHPPATEPGGLSGYLRRIASMPQSDEVINGALRLVVALSRATVGGADGVSVSLRRHGQLCTVAASDQTILDMDAGQYETGQGPCIDASIHGRRFYTEFLASESRWPAFTPRARVLGINSILSSPLRARSIPVGALNIYSRSPAAFANVDQELALVFAEETSLILSEAQADVEDVKLDDRLGEALRTRELISQAQGVIMGRDGVGEELAYTTLRRESITSGRPLRARAQEILDDAGGQRFDAPDPPPRDG